MSSNWSVSPFFKQCFVTSGVAINMASTGIVMGFTTGLLTQLKNPGSAIPIDDDTGSWIAAAPGFTLIFGNIIIPAIMAKWGRKKANILSIVLLLIGWLCISLAGNFFVLLVARLLHGISLGMVCVLAPVLIGEYSSPKNRGIFLMNMSILTSAGVLVVHALSLYVHWQMTSLIFAIITFLDLIVAIYSPESPSWLVTQGRYEETKKVFRWLRGHTEEDELDKMIDNSIIAKDTISPKKQTIKENLIYARDVFKRKEFYKPVIIMIHLYSLSQWGGVNNISVYTVDIFKYVIGDGGDSPGYVIALDSQRIISNTITMVVIMKLRRRLMLFVTTAINIIALILIAVYTYIKEKNMLPFDHPLIGVFLIHFHTFSIACGTIPMPFVISGEVFPLEFRNLAGGISVLFFSLNLTITVKTLPFLFSTIKVYGAYLLYAAVSTYCLVVAAIFLPETKDRTLQDIEDEFKGERKEENKDKSVEFCQMNILNADDSNKRLLVY